MADNTQMQKRETKTDLTKAVGSSGGLKAMLTGMAGRLEELVPATQRKYLTPERVVKIVAMAASRNPKLLECTGLSILTAVMQSVQMGLEPGGMLGHSHLVPFRNNQSGRMECQLIVGFQGYIELARRTGEISSITCNVVYKEDTFELDLASGQPPKHIPFLGGPRTGWYAVYCLARMKDGGFHLDFMTKDDVMKVKEGSKGKNLAPWKDHEEEMAKKTVLRRARKYWPMSIEAQQQLEQAEAADADSEDSAKQAVLDTMDEGFQTAQAQLEAEQEASGQEADPLAKKLAQKVAEQDHVLAEDPLPDPGPQQDQQAKARIEQEAKATRRGATIDTRVQDLVTEAYDKGVMPDALGKFLSSIKIDRTDKRTWIVDRVEKLAAFVAALGKDVDPGTGEVEERQPGEDG